ncbi:MAG TPA: N-acetylmuramoyl-L-alanine amidase [Gammaproteobacteria bacterium]|nr:N-acetylmuramoyl-L-alanine amidase [Gammaproteobacteria bacterium]
MRGIVVLVLWFLCNAVFGAEIKGVRIWAGTDRSTVVFDVSKPLEYRLSEFKNPYRLVIDFVATELPKSLKLPSAAETPIRNLRFARRNSNDLRVVFDLEHRVQFDDSQLPPHKHYGHRVVLNLTPKIRGAGEVVESSSTIPQAPKGLANSTVVRDIIVAVDAGHGGADVGAIGPTGVYEKNIVLAIARALVDEINRHDGIRGVLVRDGDYYVDLRKRMIKARDAKADLFLSIHADAFHDRRVRGSSVYVLSQKGVSNEAAHWLAENENASDLIGGISLDGKDEVLKSVLLDLSQTASLDASIAAANAILDGLKKLGKVHKQEVQHAGFMVLKSPDIPSLLIETAFISNPDEERRLSKESYRRKLAISIFSGIRTYFENNLPPGTRLAAHRSHLVSRGDSLSVIAHRYDVSMESIKLANNLVGDGVRLGEVLKIP